MLKNFPNTSGLFIVFLFAIAPLWGYFASTFLGRGFDTYTCLLSYGAVALLIYERKNIFLPTYLIYYILFMLFTVVSDKFIVRIDVGVNYIISNTLIGGLAVLLIIETINIPQRFYKWIFRINIVFLLVASLVIILQQFLSITFLVNPKYQEILINMPFEERRFPSIYTWSGNLASIGLSFFPILALVTEELTRNKSRLLWIFLIFGALVAFLNKSRFVMLNYLLILLLLPIHRGLNLRNVFRYTIVFAGILAASYFGAKSIGYDIDTIINERILEKSRGGVLEGSAGTRLLAFEIFGKLFPKNPLLGKGKMHGFGDNEVQDTELLMMLHGRSSQIHVGYLSLFYYYGLVGGILFLLFLYHLTRKLYRDAKTTERWGPMIGWVMFLLTNATGVVLYIFIMGIVVLLFSNQYYLQQIKKSNDVRLSGAEYASP